MKFILVFFLSSCLCQKNYTKRFTDDLFPRNSNIHGRPHESYIAHAKHAMVVSEGEPSTQIALDVLKKGGNAIDAGIALSFAIGVYRPHSTGIGGGGFLLYYRAKDKKTFVIDMRERAPGKASRDMYIKNGKADPSLSLQGPLSIATPGLVAGLSEIYQKFSSKKIPWKDLVLPSAKLAEDGFPVYKSMASAIDELEDDHILTKYEATKNLLTKNGVKLKIGDLYQNKNLSNTLKLIAQNGKKAFYEGPIAKEMISSIEKEQGILSSSDLTKYKVKNREPIEGNYRGFKIVSMPPPSSGGVHLVEILNILENFPLYEMPFNSAKTVHLKVEAMRRAYADRSEYLGDPDFFKVPVDGLTSKKYAGYLASTIDETHASTSKEVKPGNPQAFSKQKIHTTHFSIIDQEGNMVSSTQTINYYFGSGFVAGNTGIFMNDEMDDFSINPGTPNAYGLVGGEANAIAPYKTPLSSMTPTLIFYNNRPFMILGSPGGSRIITSVLNVILNVIDHKMNLADAVFAPRIHHQWLPDNILIENYGYSSGVYEDLKSMGHELNLQKPLEGPGNISAIYIDPMSSEYFGVSDPRREGLPLGL